jgi:hypothetical protein
MLQAPRDSGLGMAPVYEGWDLNPDNSIRLYFGYMNRNHKENLDIPVGAANAFSPGAADRGQPTHFLPRRHKQVFSINVPAGFSGPLVWTLTFRGVTERVSVSTAPAQRISPSKDPSTGNTPPRITMPASQTITFPQAAAFSITVEDDGLPKPAGTSSAAASLSVKWAKYRGPGEVTFDAPGAAVKGGIATTRATFSEPGVYVIQAVADDGSIAATSDGSSIPGSACCWANVLWTVTVKSPQPPSPLR